MARADEHVDELLKLPVEDRASAAKRLLDSLDGELEPDAAEAWAHEIERRLAKLQAGEAKHISADDAIVRIQRAARGQ